MSRPNPRNPVGLAALLFGLAIYAGLIGWLADAVGALSPAVEFLFYGIAGVAWIFPARALLRWMAHGAGDPAD